MLTWRHVGESVTKLIPMPFLRKRRSWTWLTCLLLALVFFVVYRLRLFSSLPNNRPMKIAQKDLDYMASALDIKYKLIENGIVSPKRSKPVYEAEVTLNNTGSQWFPPYGWELMFTQLLSVEPDDIVFAGESVEKKEYGFRLRHLNGQLQSISPTQQLGSLKPGEPKRVRFFSYGFNIGYSSVFPHWYLVSPGLKPRIVESTRTEPEHFVLPYDTPKKWKIIHDPVHPSFDEFNPPTARDRFTKDSVPDLGSAPIPIIPTPLNVLYYYPRLLVRIRSGQWVVVASSSEFQREARILCDEWNFPLRSEAPAKMYIQFVKKEIFVESQDTLLPLLETYKLSVDSAKQVITIIAGYAPGAFYGVQSLLALVDKSGNVPEISLTDGPRYKYRGLMLDVARNFHSKDVIKRLMDSMAMYKLNKLHLHLSDDEGWRLEIPGLEELTNVGAKTCYDLTETYCLLPFLASIPQDGDPKAEYFTVADYREILSYAKNRYIEVIPEIDLPGHSHAAVAAMKARYAKLFFTNPLEAKEFLLSDFNDKPKYKSIQGFSDGVINPCIESSYRFIDKVVAALASMHATIAPLKTFHFGGDEVPGESWTNLSMCKQVLAAQSNQLTLKEYFVSRVASITHKYGLDLAAWEDGVLQGAQPINRDLFHQSNVYAYSWNNEWKYGDPRRSTILANSGYKVIVTPATHMYLDHPYENSPDERGLVWATRYINTKKIFSLIPENMAYNAAMDRTVTGQQAQYCSDPAHCISLQKKENIEGIQGTLFGELLREDWIVQYMVFPRLLALAERAWHVAPWESEPNMTKRVQDLQQDWVNFANTLGHRELARLDKAGFIFRIPPPGAIVEDGKLKVSVTYPGLGVEMSMDEERTWHTVKPEGVLIQNLSNILLRTSFEGKQDNMYSKAIPLVSALSLWTSKQDKVMAERDLLVGRSG